MKIDTDHLEINLNLTYMQSIKLMQILVDNLSEDEVYRHILQKMATNVAFAVDTAYSLAKQDELKGQQ